MHIARFLLKMIVLKVLPILENIVCHAIALLIRVMTDAQEMGNVLVSENLFNEFVLFSL